VIIDKGHVMDVKNMDYESNFFDLIIDKSTIDALLCSDDAFFNTAQMMKVKRFLHLIIGMPKST